MDVRLNSNFVSLNDSSRVRDMNFGMNHFVLFIIGDEITRLYQSIVGVHHHLMYALLDYLKEMKNKTFSTNLLIMKLHKFIILTSHQS